MALKKEPTVLLGTKHKKKLSYFINQETVSPSNEDLKQLVVQELSGTGFRSFSNYFHNNFKAQQEEFGKNLAECMIARKLANDLFRGPDHGAEVHMKIWKLYTKSIALAPAKSEELALVYGDRSAILLHLKRYQDSIKDIDRAMLVTESSILKVMLLCLQMKCYLALNDLEMKKKTWSQIKTVIKNRNNDESLTREFINMVKQAKMDVDCSHSNDVGEMENQKVSVPLTLDSIILKYDQNNERSCVTGCNREVGDVVMCCKPYVASVNPNKFYAYCSHCLTFSWSSIPCDYCRLSMYCSENCKEEAWNKYHKIECLLIPHVQDATVQYNYYRISTKAFLMGLKEYGGIQELKEKIECQNEDEEKSQHLNSSLESILENNFLALYNMPYKCSSTILTEYVRIASQILTFIIHTTDLLREDLKVKTNKDLANDDDAVFIATLLSKIIMIIASNASHINMGTFKCEEDKSLLNCFDSLCCFRGVCIMPINAFIKQDCNPNVSRCFTSDGKIIFYANQPIRKNKQILASCFNSFYENDLILRQELLNKMFIKCTCKACSDEWPVIQDLFDRFQANATHKRYKQNILSQKFLSKYIQLDKVIWNIDFHANEKMLKNVAVDLAEVIKVCGQPSFLACIITEVFCYMFEDIYGDGVEDEENFICKC